MQYQKYNTTKNDPNYVQYWESHFQKMDLWYDWIILKAAMYTHLGDAIEECNVSMFEAKEILWRAYVAATTNNMNSPFCALYQNFVDNISEAEVPLFVAHTTIGISMLNGMTQEEAIAHYQSWLVADPNNARFGEYFITEQLAVLPVSRFYELRGFHAMLAASRKLG